MITLREMKFAVTLAKARSFSNAARELYISQPSLSQAIKTLETELAVTLFDRKSATLRLTTAGELFVREATEILAMSDALEKDMRALSQSQTVSFGISPFYGRYYLPGCLPQFKKNHPGVTVNVTECSSNDLEVLLSEKRLDLAFLPLPLRDTTLEYTPVLREEIFFAVPRTLQVEYTPAPDADSLPWVNLRQFSHLPFIYLKGSQRFTQLGNALCEAEGFAPNILYSSENWETVDAMVGKGMGVGFVPELLVNAENPTKPRYFRITAPNNSRAYVAAYLHGKKLTAPMQDLIRLMSAQSPVGQAGEKETDGSA